jgi:DNA-directed RNA polymerase
MTTIEDQIELEKRMVAYGISRYKHSVDSADENERSADSKYAQVLMREFLVPVADAIEAYCATTAPGVKAKFKSLLRQVDPMKAAYFGLRALFNHFTQESSLHKLANNIGMAIEDELKFSKFRAKHGDYYETIIRDFKKKGTKSYRHMHRVLTHKANEKQVQWSSWSLQDKISVGVKVVDIILQETDLIEKRTSTIKNKTIVEIIPSQAALDWVKDYHRYAELLNPDRVPCIIPPDDWVSLTEGGYYTPQLRHRTPMVKTRSQTHRGMFDGDISNITGALNAIQNVPWQVNTAVYDVFRQVWEQALPIGLPQSEPYVIPESPVRGKKKAAFTEAEKIRFDEWKAEARMVHSMERDRVSKCFQVVRVIRLATEYKEYEKFWFVYQCDFRGRIYASVSGLSPQGPDFAKGLLQFSNGKPLTKSGAFWLSVHGANCYGEDKVSYQDRAEWTERNADYIRRVADDPLSNTDFWGAADKPWQFLAFCFEYARYLKEGPSMMSYLPIGLDGSCNGLQNFSAMLRDEVGGRATNLVPQDKPSDIYSEVAKVCTKKLAGLKDDMAVKWRNFAAQQQDGNLPRGLAKRPVMTLPYGSTVQSCREYIYKYMVEEAPDSFPREERFRMSVYLTPILWASIADVVVAARQAMDWLQHSAGVVAKANKDIIWWTPLGFPVLQDRKKVAVRQIKTELSGMFQIRIGEQSDQMDVLKNRLAVSPNFVHSMDACHLMLTCHRAVEYGVTDFAFIHDDYGTHAADTDTLHQAIREAFVELYGESDPLIDFKIFNEDHSGIVLKDPPTHGRLKLDQVLESDYFFG